MIRSLRLALLLLGAGLPLPTHAEATAVAAAQLEAATGGPAWAPSDLARRMEVAWASRGASLEERERRLERLARTLGISGFEPVASALLLDDTAGSPLERARLAAAVAPDLPAAHAAHAAALLAEGSLVDATRAALRSLGALAHHLDSRLWLDLAVLEILERTLSWAGVLLLAVLAALAARRAAHDLGDLAVGARQNSRERTDMPGFARAALLVSALLLPVALGEGVLGAALGFFVLAVAYGDGARRLAAVVAACMVLVAVFPLSEQRQRALANAASDPVSEAAYAALHGIPTAQDRVRLQYASATRPLAALALSLAETRAGRLAQAEALLAPHVETSSDPALLNHAANLRFLRGDSTGAIALYERAVQVGSSPEILFNLSQAYGRSIRLQDQEATLARAQALDAETVTRLVAGHADLARGVVDLPVETARLLAERTPPPLHARPWHRFAPGHLGSRLGSLVLFVVAGLLATQLPRLYRRSSTCARCGVRRCPRCDRPGGGDGLCGSCARLTHSPETTDPGLRMARLADLRRRQRRRDRLQLATSLLVPGSAGLLAGRPLQALLGVVAFALAVTLLRAPSWMPPDPGSVGVAADLLFGLGLIGAGLVYAGALALGLRARSEG